MKTAISLPDGIFADAERLARRLHKTRSALYRDAIAEYLAHHDRDAVTAKLDEVLAREGSGTDTFVGTAARRTLERSDW